MKQRTAAQKRLLLLAFCALILLLGLLVWQGVRRGDAARVGIPHSVSAAGAAMLLQSPGAQYSCVVGSTAQALAEALEKGDLDAALLPADRALGLLGSATATAELRTALRLFGLLNLRSVGYEVDGMLARETFYSRNGCIIHRFLTISISGHIYHTNLLTTPRIVKLDVNLKGSLAT